MLPLFGNLENENQRDVVEGSLVWLAPCALGLGTNVVLDFGVWSRVERSALRHLAREVGAKCELVYFDVDEEVQRRLQDHRQVNSPHATIPMSDELLATYRSKFEVSAEDELTGEADDPPAPGSPDGGRGPRIVGRARWATALVERHRIRPGCMSSVSRGTRTVSDVADLQSAWLQARGVTNGRSESSCCGRE
jgi:AAA domain